MRLRLPSNWPSPLHNKCNRSGCRYANPPQVAEGHYTCKGVRDNFCCEGTYYVSQKQADVVDDFYKEEFRKAEEAKRKAEEAKKEEALKREREAIAERERIQQQYLKDELARQQASAELKLRFEAQRRRELRRGYKTSEQVSNSQPLERRMAQRKRQGEYHSSSNSTSTVSTTHSTQPLYSVIPSRAPQVVNPPSRQRSQAAVPVQQHHQQRYAQPVPAIQQPRTAPRPSQRPPPGWF